MSSITAGIGHNRPPYDHVTPSWLTGARARIARRGRAVDTSGRAHADEWILTFERTSAPWIDELTGWTGGSDTLASEVRLTFPTREQAIAYAERQGLTYYAERMPSLNTSVRRVPPWQWNRWQMRAIDPAAGRMVSHAHAGSSGLRETGPANG